MPRDPNNSGERNRTQTVFRALQVLESISQEPEEIGIVDLSERVGFPVSTVHRLIATLMDSGYVIQNPQTGRYRVGVRAFEVGNAFLKQTQLLDVVRPKMTQLGILLKETINLAIRDGSYAVYIDQKESDHPLKIFTRRGTRVPLYCTGVGKVFLASLIEAELDSYLNSTVLEPRTPNTFTSPVLLRRHLEEIRQRGFAIDNEDFQLGVRCIAAPIRSHIGATVGALSVSGPSHRLDDPQMELSIPRLLESTAQISHELGWTSASDAAWTN